MSRWFRTSDKDRFSWHVLFDVDPAYYVLYPHAKLPGSSAPRSTTISGRIRLALKHAEHITEIVACLIPRYSASYGPERSDAGDLPGIPCKMHIDCADLPAGKTDLPFVFDIPCDAFTRYSVLDRLETDPFEDAYLSVTYGLELRISRRLSDGTASTWVDELPKLKHSQKTDNVRSWYQTKWFTLIPSPAEPGEIAPPLQRVIEEFAPQLGPMTIILTSRAFTVGSVVNINISLPAVPHTSRIVEIRGFVECQADWKSPRADGPSWTYPRQRLPMFVHNPSILEESPDPYGGTTRSLAGNIVARLPDDRILSGSTLEHTKTPWRMNHFLAFELEVLEEGPRRSIITLKEKVQIASCLLISEWITVPKYGSKPLPWAEFQPVRPGQRLACACGFNIDQILERENEGITQDEDYQAPATKPPEAR